MDTRLEVLKSIEKVLEMDEDVRLGLYISYVTSVDDLEYISDEEFKRIVDHDIKVSTMHTMFKIKPNDENVDIYAHELHELTKENEREAYERYRLSAKSRKLHFPITERLSWYEFLCRLPDVYNSMHGLDEPDFDGWSVINHVTSFYVHLPQRYVPMWVVARKGDKYTCMITNSHKIPDAIELFEFITTGWCLHYSKITDQGQRSFKVDADEWFAIVFDKEGLIRPQCYPQLVYFGFAVRPDKKEYEIYEPCEAIEVFHELFGKCSEIIDS